MITIWQEGLTFLDPETEVHHLIRSTTAALNFLTHQWRWKQTRSYQDAIRCCVFAINGRCTHDDARDALVAALVGAGVIEVECSC